VTHTFLYWARDTSKAAQVRDILREQIETLAAAKVDFLILETFFCVAEMRIALVEARKTGLPIVATMSFRPHLDRTEDEVPAEELGKILAGEGAGIVGINCEQDPEAMLPILRRVADGAPRGLPLAAQPIAFRTTPEHPYYSGMPEFHGEPGLETVQVSRGTFTRFAREAVALGVRYLGGCCGCNAAYLRALAAGIVSPAGGSARPS
jgi:betaine-homocysteine S-methyltransferase